MRSAVTTRSCVEYLRSTSRKLPQTLCSGFLLAFFLLMASKAEVVGGVVIKAPIISKEEPLSPQPRREEGGGRGNGVDQKNLMIGTRCSTKDIDMYQGATEPLPNGIPTYTVEIVNVCSTGCSIANIHLSCGSFSSARLVNPKVFRRLSYNDCLVNNGEPLSHAQTLSFLYANTFPYPLAVSSLTCS